MKKTSLVVRKKKDYNIGVILGNTALVDNDQKSGLLNIKKNALIGPMRSYHTYYSDKNKFFVQTYQDKFASDDCKNLVEKNLVRVFDALEEEMLIDGQELVSWIGEYHNCFSSKSSDGKYHIYDEGRVRKYGDWTKEEFDEVSALYTRYNDSYAVVTRNGKKGLYFVGEGLLTSISYDNIEKMPGIILYTDGTTKFFEFDSERTKKSVFFTSISYDEKDNKIVYCKSGNKIYVYNLESKDLLLSIEADDVKYTMKSGDNYNAYNGEFFFIFTKNGKSGIASSNINYNIRNSENPNPVQTTILSNEYDEIVKSKYANFFYIRKGEKWGLFFGDAQKSKVVEPTYDDIDYIQNYIFRFHNGGKSTIAIVNAYNDFTTLVSDIDDITHTRIGTIFKKNDKYGIVFTDSDSYEKVIDEDFDSVEVVAGNYFLVTKDGKKGVIHLGEIIIPLEYSDIELGGYYDQYHDLSDAKMIYFALKKEDGTYSLAKRQNYNYRSSNKDCAVKFVENHTYNDIRFFRDIMVLTDDNGTIIYDYEENTLKKYHEATEVIAFPKLDEYEHEKEMYYCIDGVYYFYKDGKFEEIHTEEMDCFITTYETDTESYEAKTFNKREHDKFCDEIDGYDDEKAQETLKNYASNIYQLRNKYSSLSLKLTTKTDKK